jgi:hypothetical protein
LWTRLALAQLPKSAVDPQLLMSLVPKASPAQKPPAPKRRKTRWLRRTNIYLLLLATLNLVLFVLLWRISSRLGDLETLVDGLAPVGGGASLLHGAPESVGSAESPTAEHSDL